MRTSRYLLIILVAVAIILVWFFRPIPPSDIKRSLNSHAYMTGMIRVCYLWDRPFTVIISSIPDKTASLPSIPFFLRPLLPQTAELYIFGSKEGGGRVIAVDLGWRARLLRIMHGLIMGQIQYRGFGVVEGENSVRTPSGLKILIYQDGGTLFLAEGEEVIREITEPVQDRGRGGSPVVNVEDDIAYLSFSNNEMEFTKVIENMENDIGFLLLPSSASLSDGIIEVKYTKGDTLVVDMALRAKEGGDIEGVEGDISYLLDLSDRFLSTHNFKTNRTINKEDSKLSARFIIQPAGGKE